MADSVEHGVSLEAQEEEKKEFNRVSVDMRFYYLHREERKKKQLERYHNDPAVIAKREEKERKRAEKEAQKEAEKELKRMEREKLVQERTAKALETRRKIKTKTDGGLDEFLSGASSGL